MLRGCPERALWRAVLGEQLSMVCTGHPGAMLRPHERNAVAEARDWIGTDDFRLVCALAGCDPDWVARWVAEQLALPFAARQLVTISYRGAQARPKVLRERAA